MIRMKVVNPENQHFSVAADEPVRLEILLTKSGKIIAHIYDRAEDDEFQEPVGMFDGTLDLKSGWRYEHGLTTPLVKTLPQILRLDNGREVELDEYNRGTIEGVELDLEEVVDNTLDDFLSALSMEATDSELLGDLVYEITGGQGSTLFFSVTGDFSSIIAARK